MIFSKGENNIEYLYKMKNFLSIKIYLLLNKLILMLFMLTKSQFFIIFKIKCSSSAIILWNISTPPLRKKNFKGGFKKFSSH